MVLKIIITYRFDSVYHVSRVFIGLENGSNGLFTHGHVVQVRLRILLLLLVLLDSLLNLVLGLESFVECVNIKLFALCPVIQVEEWILQVFACRRDNILHGLIILSPMLFVGEDHLGGVTVHISRQVELLVLVEEVHKVLLVHYSLTVVDHHG